MQSTPLTSRGEELLTAAAGPAAGLLWIIPALWIGGDWGLRSAAASMVLNSFNLLPAAPLDGGRILYALTESSFCVRISTALTALLLLAAAIRLSRWLFLLPAALMLRSVFTP